MPFAEGCEASASTFAAVAAVVVAAKGFATAPGVRSLWQPAQSFERGDSPPSCQWQRKHESCPRGGVLTIPRLSQKASSPSAFDFNSPGGFVTYSSGGSPAG